MKILIQECLRGKVTVDSNVVGQIQNGEVIFVGFTTGDNEEIIDKMLEKLFKLRIFKDENGKTNINLEQTGGNILCISQFTLYADLTQGNRPSFVDALKGEESEKLYEYTKTKLKERLPDVQFGIFGADMKVELVNDGPFTIFMDSKELIK